MNKNLIHEMAKIEDNYWWFKQKRSLVKSLINKYAAKGSKLKLLDCGCGTGKTMELLQTYGTVYGTDFDIDCVNYCKKRGFKKLNQQDITKPLKYKEKFDVMVVTDVLEHIESDKLAVKQLTKSLNKNGILIMTVPAHQWMFGHWDEMLQHKRRHTVKSVNKLLSSEKNLTVVKSGYYNFQSFPPALLSNFVIMKLVKPKSQFWNTPKIINQILIVTGMVDNFLALHTPFYFGLSVYAVAKKV